MFAYNRSTDQIMIIMNNLVKKHNSSTGSSLGNLSIPHFKNLKLSELKWNIIFKKKKCNYCYEIIFRF